MQHLEEEAQWIAATLGGNQPAFAQLVERYTGAVYNLCYRMLSNQQDAEDASQEIFVRAYTRLNSFDRNRRFSTWLLSIASNYCIDRLRRRRFTWLTLDDVAFWLPSGESGPERSALQRERDDVVQRALQQLPEQYRLVTLLRYWYDMSYDEIAAHTGLTESALKTRLHRARKMLGELLAPQGVVEWDEETTS